MAQVVEHLPLRHKVLSSIASAAKKEGKKKKLSEGVLKPS
jgi:hypothetical protein